MPWYRCFIRGENFPLTAINDEGIPEGIGLYGFHATRWVVANSPEEAEMKALNLLRREKSFRPPPEYPKSKDAKIFFEEIEKTRRWIGQGQGKGATWFRMEDA